MQFCACFDHVTSFPFNFPFCLCIWNEDLCEVTSKERIPIVCMMHDTGRAEALVSFSPHCKTLHIQCPVLATTDNSGHLNAQCKKSTGDHESTWIWNSWAESKSKIEGVVEGCNSASATEQPHGLPTVKTDAEATS